MAARLNRRHQDMVRDKIQTTQLVNRLEDHALKNTELSLTQIRAIEILLKKALPDLTSVELTGEDGGPVRVERIVREVVSANAQNPDG